MIFIRIEAGIFRCSRCCCKHQNITFFLSFFFEVFLIQNTNKNDDNKFDVRFILFRYCCCCYCCCCWSALPGPPRLPSIKSSTSTITTTLKRRSERWTEYFDWTNLSNKTYEFRSSRLPAPTSPCLSYPAATIFVVDSWSAFGDVGRAVSTTNIHTDE